MIHKKDKKMPCFRTFGVFLEVFLVYFGALEDVFTVLRN